MQRPYFCTPVLISTAGLVSVLCIHLEISVISWERNPSGIRKVLRIFPGGLYQRYIRILQSVAIVFARSM